MVTKELSIYDPEFQKTVKYNFPVYAETILKIRDKSKMLVPFKLNSSQSRLHAKAEEQLREKGKVRLVVIKGRQMGISTYIQGRFYWKTSLSQKALGAFIMTHLDQTTQNLFGMTKEFYDNDPYQFPVDKSNKNELKFQHNKASYAIATTAGNKEAGRGMTITHTHLSEVAFWQNAADYAVGLGQAIGDLPGTEIIYESTANGLGNFFHSLKEDILSGNSEFEIVFLPWYEHLEYVRDILTDMEKDKAVAWQNNISEQWAIYAKTYKLTWPQLYWAYKKNEFIATGLGIKDKSYPCWKYLQEYPGTLEEAFQTSGADAFIPSHLITEARQPRKGTDKIIQVGNVPIILGVDPSRTGDKFAIIDRQGRIMGSNICALMEAPGSTEAGVEIVARAIKLFQPKLVNIDTTGMGVGIYDGLVAAGYGSRVRAVNFAQKAYSMGPLNEKTYANRRTEMWDLLRGWFEDGPVQIPDSDILHRDLSAPVWANPSGTHFNASGSLQLESKDNIKKRLGRSPDLGDAAALTFASTWEEDGMAQGGYQEKRVPRKSSIHR